MREASCTDFAAATAPATRRTTAYAVATSDPADALLDCGTGVLGRFDTQSCSSVASRSIAEFAGRMADEGMSPQPFLSKSGFLWLSDASVRSQRKTPEAEDYASLPSYFSVVRSIDSRWTIQGLKTSNRPSRVDLQGLLVRQHRQGGRFVADFKAFYDCESKRLIGLSIGTERPAS